MYNSNSRDSELGQWTTGLCGCFEDLCNCCMTFWCPCVTFGKNAEIIDKGRTTCAMAGLIFYCLSYCGIGSIYSYTYRSKLRGIFSLPEEPCMDFCVHCWCTSCAVCQEYRELKNRGLDPALGWTANEEKLNRLNPVAPQVALGMTR